MVLSTSVEVITLHRDDFLLTNVASLHVFKSVDLSSVAFLTKVRPTILNVLELLLANLLVSDSKVLIKTFLLCTCMIGLVKADQLYLPEMKWDEVGSGLCTSAASTYLW